MVLNPRSCRFQVLALLSFFCLLSAGTLLNLDLESIPSHLSVNFDYALVKKLVPPTLLLGFGEISTQRLDLQFCNRVEPFCFRINCTAVSYERSKVGVHIQMEW